MTLLEQPDATHHDVLRMFSDNEFRKGVAKSLRNDTVRTFLLKEFEKFSRQASNSKYNILSKLKQHQEWPQLGIRRVAAGHAVFFPNVSDARSLKGPDAPLEIIGDRTDLDQLRVWIDRVFSFWTNLEEGSQAEPLGPGGVNLIRRIFARVVEVRPLVSTRIATEEEERLRLTKQQNSNIEFAIQAKTSCDKWGSRNRKNSFGDGEGPSARSGRL